MATKLFSLANIYKMKIHNETNICSICDKPYKWSKRNWLREHELPEVELITAHAGCRSKMRILREKKEKLEQELVDVEWEMFKLRNSAREDNCFKPLPLLINGTYYIEN